MCAGVDSRDVESVEGRCHAARMRRRPMTSRRYVNCAAAGDCELRFTLSDVAGNAPLQYVHDVSLLLGDTRFYR